VSKSVLFSSPRSGRKNLLFGALSFARYAGCPERNIQTPG
jgi:hypothetical protein